MMNIKEIFKKIKTLVPSYKIKELEEKNKELQENLKAKQEHINKTNAYWKNEMRKAKMRVNQ
jgi:hypothetical protein